MKDLGFIILKLRWMESRLAEAGIKLTIKEESFHAPCSWVAVEDEDKALDILGPIDNIPDDDPIFKKSFTVRYIESMEDGETKWRTSSRKYATREAAAKYASGISPSRKPVIIEEQTIPNQTILT